jgi:hypothetical protein
MPDQAVVPMIVQRTSSANASTKDRPFPFAVYSNACCISALFFASLIIEVCLTVRLESSTPRHQATSSQSHRAIRLRTTEGCTPQSNYVETDSEPFRAPRSWPGQLPSCRPALAIRTGITLSARHRLWRRNFDARRLPALTVSVRRLWRQSQLLSCRRLHRSWWPSSSPHHRLGSWPRPHPRSQAD